MFKKQDEDFDEVATDPIRRRARIAELTGRRTLIFWCAMVISVCAVAELLESAASRGSAAAAAGGVLGAAISWSICYKTESDLRLLRVVERLMKDKDAKPMV